MSSVKALARCWIGYQRSCASSAPLAPNTPAGPARRWCKPQLRSGRSPAAWRRRRCLPRCWSANIAITPRSIGSRRSSPATASICRVRRSLDGLAAPAGGSRRCTSVSARTSSHRTTSLPMTRRFRCSIQAEDAPRRDGCGSTPASNDHGVDRSRRQRSICSRRTARASHLEHFRGVLHVDGYPGFEKLAARKDVILAGCWAHTRRYFYDVLINTGSPIAQDGLRRIGELYAIEKEVRGQSPPFRLAARRQRSKQIVDDLRLWLDRQLAFVPERSTIADAIRYTVARWPALTRFLDDGRVELDTNPVERAIRPVVLGRKIISSQVVMAAAIDGPCCVPCLRPASLTTSSPTPISMTCSRAWSTDTRSTASMNCCRGRGKPGILSRAERSVAAGRLLGALPFAIHARTFEKMRSDRFGQSVGGSGFRRTIIAAL